MKSAVKVKPTEQNIKREALPMYLSIRPASTLAIGTIPCPPIDMMLLTLPIMFLSTICIRTVIVGMLIHAIRVPSSKPTMHNNIKNAFRAIPYFTSAI